MRGRYYLRLTLLVLCLLPAVVQPAAAQVAVINQEYEIKAGYLLHFGRYVQWPEEPGDTWAVGILGENPFGAAIVQELETKKVQGKPVVVHRFGSMAEYRPCQILLVASKPVAGHDKETSEDRLQAAQQALNGAPVLLVTDKPGLAQKGAIMSFSVDPAQNRVRIQINEAAAKRAGLKVSAALLNLSVVDKVEDPAP